MTIEEYVESTLDDGARCLWQITPKELPADLPPMALEMWQDGSGLHFIQALTEDRGDRWYHSILALVVFRPEGTG